jgi:predicted ABC-type ATPase
MVGVIDQVVAPNRVNNMTLIFLSLQTVDLAIAGVSSRVAQGEQNALEYIVRRRFDA